MKKNVLFLMCIFIETAMCNAETPQHRYRTEQVQSRGQPEKTILTPIVNDAEIFIVSANGVSEIAMVVLISESYPSKTPYQSGIAETSATHYEPDLNKGNRKVRDVDLCSIGITTHIYSDKRNSLSKKTVKLPRGSVSCSLAVNI